MRTTPLLLLLACAGPAPTDSAADTEETAVETDSPPEQPAVIAVTVTLDGEPVPGAVVTQGGVPGTWITGADGTVAVTIDWTLEGDKVLHASHPDARIRAADAVEAAHTIELTSFDRSDNEDYAFQRPGDPTPGVINQSDACGHCHITMLEDWGASAHAASASNPVVHDVYAGTAAAYDSEAACTSAGGRWQEGIGPGTGAAAMRCYLGAGALPDLNTGCDPCDVDPVATGACADCHAPGIDGVLGGRDLLEATGTAHEAGVHCDVCHKVESIDLTAPAGVAGRLHIVRPSEPGVIAGPYQPLTFGPFHDVANPRMGSVQRDHFGQPELCAGCHELDQPALVPGTAVDTGRWPDGTLPVHTTYSELKTGVLSAMACQDCHMPVDLADSNSADLGTHFNIRPGIAGGWYRETGEVNRHQFLGPRQDVDSFLESAARLTVAKSVDTGVLTAEVTVASARPPHALPTGEPLRHLLVRLEARCGTDVLAATGGDVVPDYGGALATKRAGDDLTRWPGAQVGDVLRVVAEPGGFVDYTGYGPFGDGTFDAAAKGLAVQQYVGEAVVTGISGDVVTLDQALPSGDVVYRVRPAALPTGGEVAGTWAGAPGWGFARVLADADGNRMVPHHRAVDVVSDNRILATQSWTSTHTFAATCADPEVEAVLLYRPYPWALATERGWPLTERVVQRTLF